MRGGIDMGIDGTDDFLSIELMVMSQGQVRDARRNVLSISSNLENRSYGSKKKITLKNYRQK